MKTRFLDLLQIKEVKGFTLLELLIVISILGILATISLPIIFKQVNKARIAEAIDNLGAINRAQQAFYFDKSAFSDSLLALSEHITVGSFLRNRYRSNYYTYSMDKPLTDAEVHHLAIPRRQYINDLKSVESAVFKKGGEFKNLICEANDIRVTPNIVNITTCSNGVFIN